MVGWVLCKHPGCGPCENIFMVVLLVVQRSKGKEGELWTGWGRRLGEILDSHVRPNRTSMWHQCDLLQCILEQTSRSVCSPRPQHLQHMPMHKGSHTHRGSLTSTPRRQRIHFWAPGGTHVAKTPPVSMSPHPRWVRRNSTWRARYPRD